jgi:hypothetical protein
MDVERVLEFGGAAPPEAKGRTSMSDGVEQIFVSDEVLALMRSAARLAGELHEPFITLRTLLLALLDEPEIGPVLAPVVDRIALENYQAPQDAVTRMVASRVPEPAMSTGEKAALLRFNTLAFKVPDGSRSVWLSREAHSAWHEAARRVEEGAHLLPKHLAFGIAADAERTPGILAQLGVSPGDVTDALRRA